MPQNKHLLKPRLTPLKSQPKDLQGQFLEKVRAIFFSCDQAALRTLLSVRPSLTPFSLCSHYRIIMKFSGVITNDRSDVHAKGQGQRSRSQRSKPNFAISGLQIQFEFTHGYEMMHKAWSSIEEVILSKITRPVAAIKSLRFALFLSGYRRACLFSAYDKSWKYSGDPL